MGDKTSIEWCDATFNPWWGCQLVSPGCANCYAADIATRFTPEIKGYSKKCPIVDKPNAYDLIRRLHGKTGVGRARVFLSSMTDLFWEKAGAKRLDKVLQLIKECNRLDFLILTKRVERMRDVMESRGWRNARNIWLGVSVEDQERADERIPILAGTECEAPVRFLSVEPMLGRIDIGGLREHFVRERVALGRGKKNGINWVIMGGESGRKARECDANWFRDLIGDLRGLRNPPAIFVKQLGTRAVNVGVVALKSSKGGDIKEFPSDLAIREFPFLDWRHLLTGVLRVL